MPCSSCFTAWVNAKAIPDSIVLTVVKWNPISFPCRINLDVPLPLHFACMINMKPFGAMHSLIISTMAWGICLKSNVWIPLAGIVSQNISPDSYDLWSVRPWLSIISSNQTSPWWPQNSHGERQRISRNMHSWLLFAMHGRCCPSPSDLLHVTLM